MKPLSEELTKCAEEAWGKSSFMTISHDAFIAAYKQGYAKCVWQMSDKFNELISVFEKLYVEQLKEVKNDNHHQ